MQSASRLNLATNPLRYTLAIGALAIAYLIAARAGLMMDAVGGFATLVWAPSGLALATLLLVGPGLWPGVFIGAFLETRHHVLVVGATRQDDDRRGDSNPA